MSIAVRFVTILSGKNVFVASAVCSALIFLILTRIDQMIAGNTNPGIVYLQFSFTSAGFKDILSSWGESGIDLYLGTLWLDFLFLISYSFFLASGSAFFTLKRKSVSETSRKEIFFILIPFCAGFADVVENIIHIYLISQRFFYGGLIFISALISSLKWTFAFLSMGFLLRSYFKMRKEMHAGNGLI